MSQKDMACHKKKINMKEKIATKEITDPLFPPRDTQVMWEMGMKTWSPQLSLRDKQIKNKFYVYGISLKREPRFLSSLLNIYIIQ